MSVTTTPPVPVPASNVVPFSMPWGGAPFPPGCCPPGGMDALMQCYCDIQKTLAFMSQIMQTLMTTDPNVQAAMVTGLEKTGSNLPLIGVTNGVAAQPGQVGEWVEFNQTATFGPGTGAGSVIQTITMGVLQPGDWDCFLKVQTNNAVNGLIFQLSPPPVGFSGQLQCLFQTASDAITLEVGAERGLISVPTLIPVYLYTDSTAGGTAEVTFAARRAR